MTRQDFIAKLQAPISHMGYGESKLKILEDKKLGKLPVIAIRKTIKQDTELIIPGMVCIKR